MYVPLGAGNAGSCPVLGACAGVRAAPVENLASLCRWDRAARLVEDGREINLLANLSSPVAEMGGEKPRGPWLW